MKTTLDGKMSLDAGWAIASSATVGLDGAALSRPGVDTTAWYAAEVPSTVLAAQLAAGEHGGDDGVFVGTALRQLPGQGPAAQNFSNHPTPDDSPYAVAWWYRTEFVVPVDAGPRLRLQLDAINYRAEVWLNGARVGEELVGAYRVFELDVTAVAEREGVNVLAIRVTAPSPCDLALTWVDWNPSPPDKNLGIWRDVWLCWSGAVALRAPYVVTRLEGEARARLTVAGDVKNWSEAPAIATVRATLVGRVVEARVALAPGEQRRFELPEVVVEAPALWWPRVMGEPALHDAEVTVEVGGAASDAARFAFGIREVTSELTEDGFALHRINGRPLLVRGAGWATDLFLRRQPARDLAQLAYVAALGLDTIRFEGMLERAEVLEWCDREGILVIAGWCCCDCWEKWDRWSEANHAIAAESLRSQLERVRRHPSMLTWWYGSDFPPPARVEQSYLRVIEETGWPNAVASSAANKPTELSGRSGLKMEGPYEYVPPGYWYEDTRRGGAWGFATEISPGAAIPPIESVRKMIPAEDEWPVGAAWHFHAGGQEFHTVQRFVDALTARYGAPEDAEDLARWAQVVTYEGQRAMFEAYTRNRYRATGVIQWMLNNAWPSMIWHLHDYFLRPGGGWFGTRVACAPLHVLYGYDDRGVYVSNRRASGAVGLRVRVRVVGFDPEVPRPWTMERVVEGVVVDGDAVVRVLTLPAAEHPVTFVDVRLEREEGEVISAHTYWVPAASADDVVDYEQGYWLHTPTARHADLTALRRLPAATVVARARRDGAGAVRVEVSNESDRLAFFVQIRLTDASGADVLPVVWSDNYVSLLPGDTRGLRVVAPAGGELPDVVGVEVRGLNTATVQVAPERDEGRQAIAPLPAATPAAGAVGVVAAHQAPRR